MSMDHSISMLVIARKPFKILGIVFDITLRFVVYTNSVNPIAELVPYNQINAWNKKFK